MTTEAQDLARWLDEPDGTEPPGLDPEVLEAVYALRPEKAPAARVSVDDILASVTEGPLAAPVASKPAVPSNLPSAEEPLEAPRPANRSLARWGGFGGIGLVLAAAATFALVSVPMLQSNNSPEPPPAAASYSADKAPAPAAAPEGAPEEELAAEPTPSEPVRRAPAPRPVPSPPPVATVPPPPAADDAYDMDDAAPLRENTLIPELDDQADGVAQLGYIDEEANPAPGEEEQAAEDYDTDLVGAELDRRLDALRAAAVPGPVAPWSAGLDAAEVQRLEALFAEAATKSPQQAGDQVATAIQAPAAVAHHAAELAMDHYLAAGDAQAASSVAMRGLQFRTSTASWRHLAVRYADLLRPSDPEEAARWYEDAAP